MTEVWIKGSDTEKGKIYESKKGTKCKIIGFKKDKVTVQTIGTEKDFETDLPSEYLFKVIDTDGQEAKKKEPEAEVKSKPAAEEETNKVTEEKEHSKEEKVKSKKEKKEEKIRAKKEKKEEKAKAKKEKRENKIKAKEEKKTKKIKVKKEGKVQGAKNGRWGKRGKYNMSNNKRKPLFDRQFSHKRLKLKTASKITFPLPKGYSVKEGDGNKFHLYKHGKNACHAIKDLGNGKMSLRMWSKKTRILTVSKFLTAVKEV